MPSLIMQYHVKSIVRCMTVRVTIYLVNYIFRDMAAQDTQYLINGIVRYMTASVKYNLIGFMIVSLTSFLTNVTILFDILLFLWQLVWHLPLTIRDLLTATPPPLSSASHATSELVSNLCL